MQAAIFGKQNLKEMQKNVLQLYLGKMFVRNGVLHSGPWRALKNCGCWS